MQPEGSVPGGEENRKCKGPAAGMWRTPPPYVPADTLSGPRPCTPPAFSGPLLPLRQAWQPPHFLIRH